MKKGNVTSDNCGPQADTLTDLPVANDQAEETKGAARRTISNLVMADGHDFEIKMVLADASESSIQR